MNSELNYYKKYLKYKNKYKNLQFRQIGSSSDTTNHHCWMCGCDEEIVYPDPYEGNLICRDCWYDSFPNILFPGPPDDADDDQESLLSREPSQTRPGPHCQECGTQDDLTDEFDHANLDDIRCNNCWRLRLERMTESAVNCFSDREDLDKGLQETPYDIKGDIVFTRQEEYGLTSDEIARFSSIDRLYKLHRDINRVLTEKISEAVKHKQPIPKYELSYLNNEDVDSDGQKGLERLNKTIDKCRAKLINLYETMWQRGDRWG